MMWRIRYPDGYLSYAMIDPRCGLRRGWEHGRAIIKAEYPEGIRIEAYEPGADGTCACGPLAVLGAIG